MDFELFWQMYPRRVAKIAALKAWNKLTMFDRDAAMAALPAHLEAWIDRDMDKVPHPATWLNGQRWLDELAPRKPQVPAMSDREFFRVNGYSRQTAQRWASES